MPARRPQRAQRARPGEDGGEAEHLTPNRSDHDQGEGGGVRPKAVPRTLPRGERGEVGQRPTVSMW